MNTLLRKQLYTLRQLWIFKILLLATLLMININKPYKEFYNKTTLKREYINKVYLYEISKEDYPNETNYYDSLILLEEKDYNIKYEYETNKLNSHNKRNENIKLITLFMIVIISLLFILNIYLTMVIIFRL